MTFPTMVYKSPGPHNAGHGKTFAFIGIEDQSQLDKAISTGWSLTKVDAIYGENKKTKEVKEAQAKEEEKQRRLELEAEAEKRGLEKGKHFDGRTSTDSLNKLLFSEE